MTTYVITDAQTGLPWRGGGSIPIPEPSIAVAQAMTAAWATIAQRSLILSCPSLATFANGQPQTWTYQPGPQPVGFWVATYNAIFAAIGSSTSLSPQESQVGQTIARGLKTTGNVYDYFSTAGCRNGLLYALQRNAWATVLAQPAWLELDRVCRYAYASIASQAIQVQAAFAGTAPVWQPSTFYSGGGGIYSVVATYVIPNPANGFAYQGAGTTGSSPPVWPTTLGATVSDGSVTWTCVAATGPAGAVLPFDQTLNAVVTLNLRYNAALTLAGASVPLTSMLNVANAQWAAALAAQPAANPASDAASLTATTFLTAYLAEANTWLAAVNFQ